MAIIFTMAGMLLTLGFLRYSVLNKQLQERRIARSKALLIAETGLHYEAMKRIATIGGDSIMAVEPTTYPYRENMAEEMGNYRDIIFSIYTDANDQTIYAAKATGVVTMYNSLGTPSEITRTVLMELTGEAFSNYMYFTQSEEPGGGPGVEGGYVTFGASDILEGKVHTNDTLMISEYGCPSFTGNDSSLVEASGGISWGMCDSSIFSGEWDDSATVIQYPPDFSVRAVKNAANFVFTADDLIGRSGKKDTLIMTEIEFQQGGFIVSQWPYLIPPVSSDGPEPITYTWDSDTTVFGVNAGSIGFDESFSATTGYAYVDTVVASVTDIDGNSVTTELSQYEVGDTIFVSSDNPDSTKNWYGIIQHISPGASRYVFTVIFNAQYFLSGGFQPGESVTFHYLAPLDSSTPYNNFAYYHSHPNNGRDMCQTAGLHHFDFPPPSNSDDYFLPPTAFSVSGSKVIYVKEGQLRVKGIVDGKYTIVTDGETYYRRHDDSSIWDRVFDNIWITDDLIYIDADRTTGAVPDGSPHRLGLISGANIIIAATAANGAGNGQAGGIDVKINAALMALNESFECHYWHNSLSSYYQPNMASPQSSLGDGRGPNRIFGVPYGLPGTVTGSSDIRGIVHLWGSINQLRRGYMKRNAPGPYSVSPGVGYTKDYHFDYNLLIYPPPYFPITTDSDGNLILVMQSYGEIDE